MDQGDWGILLGVVGIALTIIFGVPAYRRRGTKPHWTQPTWTSSSLKQFTHLLPVLKAQWEVRGTGELQNVECAVQSPSGAWQPCSSPTGTLTLPKRNMYTYIDLRNGHPFNTTIASPVHHGKPVTDLTGDAVTGKYVLRIRWYEPTKPSQQREVTFTHIVR